MRNQIVPSLYLKTHEHSSSSFRCTPFSVDYKVIYHAINTVFPLCPPVIVLWILSLSSIKHFVTQIILLLNWCCFCCLGYTFSLLFPALLADSHPDWQTWAHPFGSSDYKLSLYFSWQCFLLVRAHQCALPEHFILFFPRILSCLVVTMWLIVECIYFCIW